MNINIMDFLWGFGSVVVLIQVTSIVVLTLKKYPYAGLGIAVGMFALDLVVLVVWLKMLTPFVESKELFVGGMGLAILSSLLYKVKKFFKLT